MMLRHWGKQTYIVEVAHNKLDQWFKGKNCILKQVYMEYTDIPTLWILVGYLCASYLDN